MIPMRQQSHSVALASMQTRLFEHQLCVEEAFVGAEASSNPEWSPPRSSAGGLQLRLRQRRRRRPQPQPDPALVGLADAPVALDHVAQHPEEDGRPQHAPQAPGHQAAQAGLVRGVGRLELDVHPGVVRLPLEDRPRAPEVGERVEQHRGHEEAPGAGPARCRALAQEVPARPADGGQRRTELLDRKKPAESREQVLVSLSRLCIHEDSPEVIKSF
mmetsp:Transcript_25905/g.44678  ORF Transcript_25905/g.44678 Transcript_25905/m.44678 type:complete len:216 (+) Transcript_25905:224-871(+)